MRVMLMHKSTPDTEAGVVPPASLIQAVGAMIGDMQKAHLFRDGAGLRASSLGVRLTFTGGKRSETLGPFTGRNEMVAALGIVKTHTREEAVEIGLGLVGRCGIGWGGGGGVIDEQPPRGEHPSRAARTCPCRQRTESRCPR